MGAQGRVSPFPAGGQGEAEGRRGLYGGPCMKDWDLDDEETENHKNGCGELGVVGFVSGI